MDTARRFILISVLALLPVTSPGQNPSTDFFPLAVGNTWTYAYFAKHEDKIDGVTVVDSGSAMYRVVSTITTSDSLVWAVLETRTIRHSYTDLFDQSHDTSFSL
jgi:hypothetical protein